MNGSWNKPKRKEAHRNRAEEQDKRGAGLLQANLPVRRDEALAWLVNAVNVAGCRPVPVTKAPGAIVANFICNGRLGQACSVLIVAARFLGKQRGHGEQASRRTVCACSSASGATSCRWLGIVTRQTHAHRIDCAGKIVAPAGKNQ